MINADRFRSGIETLWGYGAQGKAARHFEVADRTVRRWIAGEMAVPATVMAELDAMLSITPPPGSTSDEDRDDACRDAIEPALTDLRNRAIGAGWHPAEVATAILALTISEMRAGAGDEATRQTLQAAMMMLDG